MRRRRPTRTWLVAGATVVVAACGAGQTGSDVAVDTMSSSATRSDGAPDAMPDTVSDSISDDRSDAASARPPSSAGSSSSASSDGPATLDAPAVVTSTSERLDRPTLLLPPDDGRLEVAWVGGSDVVLGDVSLPGLAAGSFGRIAGDDVTYTAVTGIAPDPTATRDWFLDALGDGAEAVIMSANVAWLYGRECTDAEPGHPRYACLLAPVSAERADALRAPVSELFDTVAASRIPTAIVITPHSTSAMEDPALTDLIATAEASMAALVPSAPSIHVVQGITRGRSGFAEGDGFYNAVHPTPAGAERLVDLLLDDVGGWWVEIGAVG